MRRLTNAHVDVRIQNVRALATSALRAAEQAIRELEEDLPVDLLRSKLRPATRLRTRSAADADIPLGASRIGGRPDLPPSFEWPRWDGFDEPDQVLSNGMRIPMGCKPKALSFLAQVNLAEAPDATGLLPEQGWLCFFYDAEGQPWGFDPRHRGGARVAYFESERSSLIRTDAPAGAGVFAPMVTTPDVVATLPAWSYQLGVELEPQARIRYQELIAAHFAGNEVEHRMLGWPKQIQEDMERECELVTNGIHCGDGPDAYESAKAKQLEPNVKDWIMLLQVETDEDGPGWMWGDTGCVYFWIRKQDLAARRFDRCWAVLQCT